MSVGEIAVTKALLQWVSRTRPFPRQALRAVDFVNWSARMRTPSGLSYVRTPVGFPTGSALAPRLGEVAGVGRPCSSPAPASDVVVRLCEPPRWLAGQSRAGSGPEGRTDQAGRGTDASGSSVRPTKSGHDSGRSVHLTAG